ncbi:hypothetical protein KAX02_03500 [candidate division WOR-3 bacterium]|nr:hypothetical protein [candidate division WOR-3 bacterium]
MRKPSEISGNRKGKSEGFLTRQDVVYIHITRRFVDIYREEAGKYQQLSFRVKRTRGRFNKRRKDAEDRI